MHELWTPPSAPDRNVDKPVTVVPTNWLQHNVWARQWNLEMMRIQGQEISKELLKLNHKFAEIALGQILYSEAFHPVCEDCTVNKRLVSL